MEKPTRRIVLDADAVRGIAQSTATDTIRGETPAVFDADGGLVMDFGRAAVWGHVAIGAAGLAVAGGFLWWTLVRFASAPSKTALLSTLPFWVGVLAILLGGGIGALMLLVSLRPIRVEIDPAARQTVTTWALGMRRTRCGFEEVDRLVMKIAPGIDKNGFNLIATPLTRSGQPLQGVSLFSGFSHPEAANVIRIGCWLADRFGAAAELEMERDQPLEAVWGHEAAWALMGKLTKDPQLSVLTADAVRRRAGFEASAAQRTGDAAEDRPTPQWEQRYEVIAHPVFNWRFRGLLGLAVGAGAGASLASGGAGWGGLGWPWDMVAVGAGMGVIGGVLGLMLPIKRRVRACVIRREAVTIESSDGHTETLPLEQIEMIGLQSGVVQSWLFSVTPRRLVILTEGKRLKLTLRPELLAEACDLLTGACINAIGMDAKGELTLPTKPAGWSLSDWRTYLERVVRGEFDRQRRSAWRWAMAATVWAAMVIVLILTLGLVAGWFWPPTPGPAPVTVSPGSTSDVVTMIYAVVMWGALLTVMWSHVWRLQARARRALDRVRMLN